MKGWLFGDLHQKEWTQKIYKFSKKFQNPLHQNYKHVITLAELLDLNQEHIFSVVVFIGDSSFKTEMPENVCQAMSYIRYIQSKTTAILDSHEVKEIITKIESGRLQRSLKTDFQHIKHVKSIIAEKEVQASKTNSCSKCGAEMVLRTVNKGENQGNQF